MASAPWGVWSTVRRYVLPDIKLAHRFDASAGAEFSRLVLRPINLRTLWPDHDVTLWLVRHGQALPAHLRTDDEILDPPLTEVGRRQAEAVARRLADVDVSVIFTSPLKRAIGTAEAVARVHDL